MTENQSRVYPMLQQEDDDTSLPDEYLAVGGPTAAATKEASALLISASDKAGMVGIDRERINAILLRESGNSTFMQRQRAMDENTNKKIEDLKRRLFDKENSATNDWRRDMKQFTIDKLLRNYRSQRRRISACAVIDMDGFFISCHILDHPHLENIPACVGGTSMISTSNYVARQYGVRAAMPGYIGSTLVKELSGGKQTLTFVKSDFDLYKKKSSEVRAVLEEYDPNLQMHSLDEAYMDIGPYLERQLLDQTGELSHEDIRKNLLVKTNPSKHNGDQSANQMSKIELHGMLPLSKMHAAAKALLHSIRQKVKDTTGLTCSAGLSSNFLLAKIASDVNKPNGQHFVGPSEEEINDFVNPLPIRKVNGIGRVMEKTLRGTCGVETVKDLYDKRAEVYFLFKPATAQFLMRASIGYSEGKHHASTEEESSDADDGRKGISHERTFSPISSWSDMCTKLEGITLSLVDDIRTKNLRPKTITLKVKLTNFDILSRATTRDVALFQNCNNRSSAQDLVDIVINLLKEAKREHEREGTSKNDKSAMSTGSPFSVRLLGVRCSNFQLQKDTNQLSLDRYRTSGHMDNSFSHMVSNNEPQTSPIVNNPYVSRKAMPSSETVLVDKAQTNATNSKRSLYRPSLSDHSDPKPSCNKAPTENSKSVQCPLCCKYFQTDKHGNAEINAHIDSCLNTSTVKELAREETLCANKKIEKKRRRLTDFFSS